MKYIIQRGSFIFAKTLAIILPIVAILSFIWFIIVLSCFPEPSCCHKVIPLLNAKVILGILGSSLTLWVISYNLTKYIDIETVKSLGYLRERLNSGEKAKIHFYLLDDSSDKTAILGELEKDERYRPKEVESLPVEDQIYHSNVELFDYLGTIELGVIMLKSGLIDKQEFKNQFGYRIENIINCDSLMKYIKQSRAYYSELLSIIKDYERL